MSSRRYDLQPKMMTDTSKVSVRRGIKMPLTTGRVETAGRSVAKSTDPCGRTGDPAGKGMYGGGDRKTVTRNGGDEKVRFLGLNSRKYGHVSSTISVFMKKGISEPRRYRSLPIVKEIPVPFMKNKNYAYVPSTIGKFLKTGIREPQKVRSLPVVEKVPVPFVNKNNKYSHIGSTIQEFMKTGIREPRRLKVQSSQEELPKPFKSNNKKYSHVKSRVAVYIQKSMEEYYLAGRKLVSPIRKQPSGKTNKIPVPIQISAPLCDKKKDENIIATLEKSLRDVNGEQPTMTRLTSEFEMKTKFPNYTKLILSDDPFEQVLALGLGYHYKFMMDFDKQ